MKVEIILSYLLGLAGLLTFLKAWKDYLKNEKEKYIEGLGAKANDAVLKRLDELEVEQEKIKEKLAKHEGIIDAIFKMRKE